MRGGLPLLAAGFGEQTTAQLPQDTGKTRTFPAVVAAGRRPSPPASFRRRRALLPLIAALLGAVLLGGLVWALSQGASEEGTSEAGGAERVEVPDVVGLSRGEVQKRLDDAGLRLGSQDETSSGEVAAGAVIEQNPAAGTKVDRGDAVDVVVSTGSAQEPTTTATASPASASPASDEERKEAQEEAKEAAKEAKEAREEATKELEEELKEVQKELEKKELEKGEGKEKAKGKKK
jgi:hypothetical protein